MNGLNQNLEESNEALEQRHKEDQEDIATLEKQVNQLEQQLTKTGEELDQLKVRLDISLKVMLFELSVCPL